jgi:hypothetical protein
VGTPAQNLRDSAEKLLKCDFSLQLNRRRHRANNEGQYPRLTAEMIRLAPVYAAAYPLRGRPRKQPWRDNRPVR